VLQHYGIAGKAKRLRGERDDNFLIDGNDGARLVLKVAHPREEPLVTNLQTSLLLCLAATVPSLTVPRIVATCDGLSEVPLTWREHAGRTARVTSYLYGRPMHLVPTSASLRRNVGVTLARLTRGLRDFTHPAEDRILIWDLRWAGHLRDLLPAIADQQIRRSLLRHIDRFDGLVWPQVAGLRAQMIHNDFNSDNVLIDPFRRVVSGVLDFGDAVRAPRIVDVAVAAAYHLTDDSNPAAGAIDLAVGYHEIEPLPEEELALFYDLVLMRQIFRMVITAWRASIFPADREYILRHHVNMSAQFRRLEGTPRDAVFEDLMRRCGLN
jgi:hydroxylysine kinase